MTVLNELELNCLHIVMERHLTVRRDHKKPKSELATGLVKNYHNKIHYSYIPTRDPKRVGSIRSLTGIIRW